MRQDCQLEIEKSVEDIGHRPMTSVCAPRKQKMLHRRRGAQSRVNSLGEAPWLRAGFLEGGLVETGLHQRVSQRQASQDGRFVDAPGDLPRNGVPGHPRHGDIEYAEDRQADCYREIECLFRHGSEIDIDELGSLSAEDQNNDQ